MITAASTTGTVGVAGGGVVGGGSLGGGVVGGGVVVGGGSVGVGGGAAGTSASSRSASTATPDSRIHTRMVWFPAGTLQTPASRHSNTPLVEALTSKAL